MKYLFLLVLCCLFVSFSSAQNIGIGTPQPTEKLEVGGMIFTNQGGVKFPDSTVQTTAAYSNQVPNPNISGRVRAEMFLINPNIPSGSASGLPLLSAVNGVSLPNDVSLGGSGTSGKSTFEDFTVTRNVDMYSSQLHHLTATGGLIVNIIVNYYLSDGNNGERLYQRYTFEECYLTSFFQNFNFHPSGYYQHIETVSFAFGKICINSYDDIGRPLTELCWDLRTNSP